ncbi:DUF4232 domain-containing protein [Streptomyces sp. 6N223]|uniref:DUF4232 domain-containing protein n=1 Tax=Streptomyces sp. 6N223 TaxID=3457412 RepID=UPI003FD2D7C1
MRSPTDPRDPRDEPGEILEAFGTPQARLDPPPGAFASLRRRAAARRRRRAFAAATGVAACLAGVTTAIAFVAPGDGDGGGMATTTAPPVATDTSSPTDRSGEPSRTPDASSSTSSSSSSSTSASPDPGGGPGETPTCATSQLELTAGRTDSGAGSMYVPLEFTNAGEETCAMLGYPGVSLVAESDGTEQVGAPATRGTERGDPVVVNLAPGATATADLRITRAENYPTATCDPEPTRGLRVYPPNQRASIFLPYENATGCASEEVELLEVTVVYADEP